MGVQGGPSKYSRLPSRSVRPMPKQITPYTPAWAQSARMARRLSSGVVDVGS